MNENNWPSEALKFAAGLVHSIESGREWCVLDVGAHKGETFRHISSLIPGRLRYFGFEPNPESFQALAELEKSKHDTDQFVSFSSVAVGAKAGRVAFRVANASEVSGILSPESELLNRVPAGDHALKSMVEVEQICVDDFISDENLTKVDILKIDTEGYDLEVIRGAMQSLGRGLIDVVVCEVFFVKYREGQAYFWDIAAELGKLGFSFVNLFDTRDTGQGRLYTGNAIWVSPALSAKLFYL